MSGAALFFTRGNVTAEEPMMQDGDFRAGNLEAHLGGYREICSHFFMANKYCYNCGVNYV